MKKQYISRIILWFIVVAWMAFIFSMSAENASESNETSGGTIRAIVSFIVPGYSEMEIEQQNEIVDNLQFFVRKTAHFSIYAVLGILTFAAVSQHCTSSGMRVGISVLICALYSVSDEIHQLYTPGRSCELRDMCIDTCGALVGILIALGMWKLITILGKKRNKTKQDNK